MDDSKAGLMAALLASHMVVLTAGLTAAPRDDLKVGSTVVLTAALLAELLECHRVVALVAPKAALLVAHWADSMADLTVAL
jgi:hypothetical protein